MDHSFGGGWTEQKLSIVKSYLMAYQQVMKNQRFETLFIDAFAGTGYRNNSQMNFNNLLFPIDDFEETDKFLAGSSRIALEISPPFSQYIFIEKDQEKCTELENLKKDFPNSNISIINEDANIAIKEIVRRLKWNSRAVLFLDPYGMSVEWDTIKLIAETKKIDLWYLFPLGIGVNRLLVRDGVFPEGFKEKLDRIFGDTSWKEEFYRKVRKRNLFGEVTTEVQKIANFHSIEGYILKRLKTIFAGVADRSLTLYNSKNSPLYLLCFAVGNKNGKSIALKIAQYILGSNNNGQ